MTDGCVDCVLYRVTLPEPDEPGWLKEDFIVTVLGGVIISFVGLGFNDDGVTFLLEYDDSATPDVAVFGSNTDSLDDFTQGAEWKTAAIGLKTAGYDIERVAGYVLPITILGV